MIPCPLASLAAQCFLPVPWGLKSLEAQTAPGLPVGLCSQQAPMTQAVRSAPPAHCFQLGPGGLYPPKGLSDPGTRWVLQNPGSLAVHWGLAGPVVLRALPGQLAR